MFILSSSPEVKDASEHSGLVLEFAALQIFCADHLTEQRFAVMRAQFSIGWFNAGVEWSITALTSHLIAPVVQREQKELKDVLFVVFFSSSSFFCGAIGETAGPLQFLAYCCS